MSSEMDLYGTAEEPLSWHTLRAGPLTVELEQGQLRYLRFGDVEVLRAVSFLSRDRYWGTYAAEISDLQIVEANDSFLITYSGRCAPGEGDLRYEVRISGSPNRLRFEATGGPQSDLLTNRTGFVVLHRAEGVAGELVIVEHASSELQERVRVPLEISPSEPVKDIRAITHEPAGGIRVRVEMTGDAYDMEDQRNWTDASFKTYIRPLSKPRPFVIKAGEVLHQSVEVSILGRLTAKPNANREPTVARSKALHRLPPLSITVEGGLTHIARAAEWLVMTSAESILGRPTSPSDVSSLARLAGDTGTKLELQFPIQASDPSVELQPWSEAARSVPLHSVLAVPYRLYPLRPPDETPGNVSLADIARATRSAFPDAQIGGGVMTGFTELNRNRPPHDLVDFVTYSTSAIVHAADDRSVVETLECLPSVLASSLNISRLLPLRLGPTGIGLALNPDGPPRSSATQKRRATMLRDDPRQRGLFAAAWTLAYATRVAAYSIASWSPAHLLGDFGIFDDDGSIRPIAHVVRLLGSTANCLTFALQGLPPGVAGLGVETERGIEMWFSNLSSQSKQVRLAETHDVVALDQRSMARSRHRISLLDEFDGRARVVELSPFAVARVRA